MALSKINPSKLDVWSKLKRQFQLESNYHLLDFFQEKDRLKYFTINEDNFYVDFSKNRLSKKTFNLLISLCDKTDLKANIDKYFKGLIINETENRAVTHTSLRSKEKNDSVNSTLEKIKNISNEINNGKRKGFTGKKFTDIVNIGIGGSHLGPEMVTKSLSFYSLGIKPHYISNIDSDFTNHVLGKLDPETTIFIIVSKTFTTIETIKNAEKVKNWFLEKTNVKSIEDHFIAVSNNIKSPEKFGVNRENILSIPESVGGRFSLWGSVGLVIAIVIGYKNFEKFQNGAESMDQHFKNTSFEKNIPVVLALISIWYNNFFKYETEAVLPYSQFLDKLPDYLQQVSMESNGKNIDRNGERVDYETGSIIWGSTGTNAQHAFFQLMHQGTKIIPADFIAFKNTMNEDKLNNEILNSNFLAQTNALMKGSRPTTKDTHKNIEGNKPSTSIVINKLNPSNLGSLISIYEHKIFTVGSILNLYSYDQWGVELGKSIAKEISSGIEDNLDDSTKKLKHIFKS